MWILRGCSSSSSSGPISFCSPPPHLVSFKSLSRLLPFLFPLVLGLFFKSLSVLLSPWPLSPRPSPMGTGGNETERRTEMDEKGRRAQETRPPKANSGKEEGAEEGAFTDLRHAKKLPLPLLYLWLFSRRLPFLRPRWHCSSCRLSPPSSFLHATLRSRNSESFERRRQRKNISSPSLAQRRNKPMAAAAEKTRGKKRGGEFFSRKKNPRKTCFRRFFFTFFTLSVFLQCS